MAITDHPNYIELVNRTNTIKSRAITAQGIYFASYGKFFQGIAKPDAIPDGTNAVSFDVDAKPTDQPHSWNDFDPVGYAALSTKRMRVRIDVYESEAGWGWILKIEFRKAGIGPDAYGTDGDHWVYRYHEGTDTPDGIFDEWYIQPDSEVL